MEDTIYFGSLWHQDCDPFLSVIATDLNVAESKLLEMEQEEYERILGEFDVSEEHAPNITICNSGLHPEDTANLEMFICFQHSLDEAMADLEEHGYFIC